MTLSAPTQLVYIIAVIVAIIGLVAYFGVIAAITVYAFWIMTVAFVVLAVACLMRGM